jgi:hypothetical protein
VMLVIFTLPSGTTIIIFFIAKSLCKGKTAYCPNQPDRMSILHLIDRIIRQ